MPDDVSETNEAIATSSVKTSRDNDIIVNYVICNKADDHQHNIVCASVC